ncbi:hypothetical protein HELRODRAFT_158829 [Helobdella robusta]|uniref:Uncharacterized protein n=1 Tax=Helobdella robusta TaxID=6412 RepID=T1ENB3_HELRO|nr:hypothetical protein HELRODRAFT_158829 [Helobdella robusta]ESO12331.1 hypothetical protein HELRODRAFT_158829 [Helobdella robusta]
MSSNLTENRVKPKESLVIYCKVDIVKAGSRAVLWYRNTGNIMQVLGNSELIAIDYRNSRYTLSIDSFNQLTAVYKLVISSMKHFFNLHLLVTQVYLRTSIKNFKMLIIMTQPRYIACRQYQNLSVFPIRILLLSAKWQMPHFVIVCLDLDGLLQNVMRRMLGSKVIPRVRNLKKIKFENREVKKQDSKNDSMRRACIGIGVILGIMLIIAIILTIMLLLRDISQFIDKKPQKGLHHDAPNLEIDKNVRRNTSTDNDKSNMLASTSASIEAYNKIYYNNEVTKQSTSPDQAYNQSQLTFAAKNFKTSHQDKNIFISDDTEI